MGLVSKSRLTGMFVSCLDDRNLAKTHVGYLALQPTRTQGPRPQEITVKINGSLGVVQDVAIKIGTEWITLIVAWNDYEIYI